MLVVVKVFRNETDTSQTSLSVITAGKKSGGCGKSGNTETAEPKKGAIMT